LKSQTSFGCLGVFAIFFLIYVALFGSGVDSTPTPSPTPSVSDSFTPTPEPTQTTDAIPKKKRGEALRALAKLPIKGRAPKTGYSREMFSDDWDYYNGCDVRNRILARDLVQYNYRSGSNCIIETGVLQDPFTGQVIAFVRGVRTSLDVQIDHVVSLSDAWQKGAQQLSSYQRFMIYNDPLNLLAVWGPANSQKSDSDAASWLPSNKSFRCSFVARQIAVKVKYQLWVTQAEHDAMTRVLASCPKKGLPN
jgi:hypothetical protein